MASVKDRRGPVLARLIAAVPLGYAATSTMAAAIGHLLPGDRAQAALTGMLLSFALYTGLVVYVFAARTSWRALVVTVVLTVGGALLTLVPVPWVAAP